MKVERIAYGAEPEKIAQERFDCIWIAFGERSAPAPLRSPALQWVDWKLQGQLSRFLLDERRPALPTFLPTMKKLPSPYVALQRLAEVNWEHFSAACGGLKIRRLLYFCEDPARVAKIERVFRDRSFPAELETVMLGSDA